ncbi:YqgE/AlgH family protein [Candidatus Nesciobacter abundans]|uniref:YqgE/AlgH family protein n=1 Tax=Candidatus Nesciobacter abundans TaxID=2601668 RepID=A0A5C0UFK0_9PROT|nr:YqgE/AlgH family protein [Candidatus Nesciobacter abundans]QEK38876.1 hypothetical protein FZC36_00265 [Candidatus Nesciobacter abundans]
MHLSLKKENLVGKFLISSPFLDEKKFKKTLILITECVNSNIIGVAVNKKMSKSECDKTYKDYKIYYGGDLSPGKGLVMYDENIPGVNKVEIMKNIFISNLEEMFSKNIVPKSHIAVMGHFKWNYSSLIEEAKEGNWIPVEGFPSGVIGMAAPSKWYEAYHSINIRPECLCRTQ